MANKDFFLTPDDAQTLGDINYMRKSVRVKHTFPKTLKNPGGFSVEKEVSSSEGRTVNGIGGSVNDATSSSSTFQPAVENPSSSDSQPAAATPKKRPQGSSMDMFRNMARNINKK